MNAKINSSTVILIGLANYAADVGLSTKKQPAMIPEINVQAGHVSSNLFNTMADFYEKRGQDINIDIYLIWCTLAGIGGSLLWNERWEEIRDTGVFNALLEKYGVYQMDEYVLELAGHPENTAEGKRIGSLCQLMATYAYNTYFNDDIDDSETALKQISEIGKALYNFGVSYGLEMLGM